MTNPSQSPSPYPRPDQPPDLMMAELLRLRRALRQANRERGRTSLTLHLTRLELQSVKTKATRASEEIGGQSAYASRLYHMVRELIECLYPGYSHGDLDEDFKWAIGEIHRLRINNTLRELHAEQGESGGNVP